MLLQYLVHCFRVGRATYVDASYVTDVDAGAYGVTVWLKALSSELKIVPNEIREEDQSV